ncbi:Cytosine deaminase [Hypsizygus marmoreus]|uniref:Cytosine deaminase n=1 Tax=Hypsizygus marmoreus TaxID=39966 RepID=A0A369J7I5_HYPMA|nr:Cytosine deaminase [Hypsizygus marmoreus]
MSAVPPSALGTSDELSTEERNLTSLTIANVRLPHEDRALASRLWRLKCKLGKVEDISLLQSRDDVKPDESNIDAQGSILIPSFCHSHVHLDKCFILDRCTIVSGEFHEALEVTGRAKAAFPLDLNDLYDRGARLIRESVQFGVTSMRAHVEVDSIVGFACLDVAQALQRKFELICDVQIAVFAQEPLFGAPGDTTPGLNFTLLQQALQRDGLTVVGSAPYVEPTIEQAKSNIALVMDLAVQYGAHLDFHLDYNLDADAEPLIYEVISQARRNHEYWTQTPLRPRPRRITVGHATRLQLFTPAQWHHLAEAIKDLPITLVGLPQSDMYMQGRQDWDQPLGAPRSTLRVPHILNEYGIEIAMSVNNVGNAFTPQGSLDPLSLCTFGVAVFQSATPADIQTLVRSVTLTSKITIGQDSAHLGLFPTRGDPADFVILHGTETLQSAVLHPAWDRTTIRAGVMVSRRQTQVWFFDVDEGNPPACPTQA